MWCHKGAQPPPRGLWHQAELAVVWGEEERKQKQETPALFVSGLKDAEVVTKQQDKEFLQVAANRGLNMFFFFFWQIHTLFFGYIC